MSISEKGKRHHFKKCLENDRDLCLLNPEKANEKATDIMEITGTSGAWAYERTIRSNLRKFLEEGEKIKFSEAVD